MRQQAHDLVELTIDEHIAIMGIEFAEMREILQKELAPAFTKFTAAIRLLIDATEPLIRWVATRYYDIPESDIRDVHGCVVRLWNHRRIDIQVMRALDNQGAS